MSIGKKILFVALFVVCALVLPAVILIGFVDSVNYFSVYVITYGVILFAIFGYIIVSIKNMSKELNNAVEEMKKQNAAIAYKLTSGNFIVEDDIAPAAPVEAESTPVADAPAQKVNLNPADDFVAEAVAAQAKTDIDDFE
ncbi:MAG: hypothetical protein J6Q83_08555 [Clostridia bacterium]|nr:hypothetical protein [Clostridia bacterium]